jgi:hypothetical protein
MTLDHDTETAAYLEPWEPKNQPQPADVVPSITGDSGEVWIFQGVKVATHTDINAAFAMRDKINQAGEQWLQAWGFSSRQDRNGNLSVSAPWARCRGCGHEYYPFHERGTCMFHFSNEAVCPCDGWAGVGAYT